MSGPRVKYHFLPFRFWGWIGGMTLYPWILFKRPKNEISDRLFRHELEHWYTVQKMGWIKFYASYLWESVKHGYEKNKYELAAEAVEQTPLTEQERQWKENS
jgi:hypothetical protein